MPTDIVRMRRSLADDMPPPTWPAGVRPVPFGAARAVAVHRLLIGGYAKGFGTVGPFEQWWPELIHDTEYDPHLCVAAVDVASDVVVGVAQCWTSAFVKDVAVDQRWRRKGVGLAILSEAFGRLHDRGVTVVDLKVEAGNAVAIALYRRAGMVPVEPT